MFKQICKIVWFQRRSNGWIFLELLVVLCGVWFMLDNFLVNTVLYHSPMGVDITNTYRLKLAMLTPDAAEYVDPQETKTRPSEDLLTLMERLRREPEIEEVCATFYSCPYSSGNSHAGIRPVDGDTTLSSYRSFQVRRVTPEYFSVFRVLDKNGDPVYPQLDRSRRGTVITVDMEQAFYKGENGKGRYVQAYGEEQELPIQAVAQNIRMHDYQRNEPNYFQLLQGDIYTHYTENVFQPHHAELAIRTKKYKTPEEVNLFLESITDRLRVNNLYVYGHVAFETMRENYLRYDQNKQKIRHSIMAFVLVNVFFGIIATFWIRTQKSRSEMGLRVALGSSTTGLCSYLLLEGLALLLFTVPVVLLFVGTTLRLDLLDTHRLALSWWRFAVTLGSSYLVIAGMVCMGIFIPAWKVITTPPAEALHYE
ncbi:MAG: multidrug ABC transporter substrate-binding protein [Tannerellaceae bacterium]|nr:multidrug ABC transporter substrate-binding protein [Tannerellaceae bacterium]